MQPWLYRTTLCLSLIAALPAAVAATPADVAVPGSTEASMGEVRKIDHGQQKITLRHGDIPNLGMPPMTMVFRVSDPQGLLRVKVGDRVQFRAEARPEGYTVVWMQAAP
jgi:Cu(I)/Ag(I) efflux system protein CusF